MRCLFPHILMLIPHLSLSILLPHFSRSNRLPLRSSVRLATSKEEHPFTDHYPWPKLREVASDNAIRLAVKSIKNKDVKSQEGCLKLPKGQVWPGTANNNLFVRDCYAPLFDDVLMKCNPTSLQEDDTRHRQIITGHPGIGKSLFG